MKVTLSKYELACNALGRLPVKEARIIGEALDDLRKQRDEVNEAAQAASAKLEKLEALFQQTHGCHHSWAESVLEWQALGRHIASLTSGYIEGSYVSPKEARMKLDSIVIATAIIGVTKEMDS